LKLSFCLRIGGGFVRAALGCSIRRLRKGNGRHRCAGTQVDKAKSINGAMPYLTKDISKDDQMRPGNFTGRYWGRFNAQALPVCQTESIDLTGREGGVGLRWARRITQKHVENSRWNAALRRPGHMFSEKEGLVAPGRRTGIPGAAPADPDRSAPQLQSG
jgi:hypothetical protein